MGVSIRLWSLDDASELAALYSRDRAEVLSREPWRPDQFFTPEGQRSRVSAAATTDPPHHGFVIVSEGRLVGTIGLSDIGLPPGSTTVGYWVNVADRGRDIAKEALRLMLDHCFQQLGLGRVYANTLPTNQASRRVLQENGFRQVGTVRLEPDGLHLRYVRDHRSA